MVEEGGPFGIGMGNITQSPASQETLKTKKPQKYHTTWEARMSAVLLKTRKHAQGVNAIIVVQIQQESPNLT